ncbi:MAG: hypothetical protein FJX11_21825 [Alphaproteobacteria bacterium]|nr:hypothetical protein [Alphaproteobacteria bacterium]
MRRVLAVLIAAVVAPVGALGQSASEVERCFQNPAACGQGGGAAGAPAVGGGTVATRPAAAPDYTTVLQSPEPERKRIQESLRTLDKYNGRIDGDLQSDATVKAIQDWQKGRGSSPVGKLTPQEAQQLNAEAARTPIRRLDPTAQTAAAAPTPLAQPQSNADALKALQARVAERRKAAEPKAEAATQALVRDLKAYVAADGKGVAGEQFADFAKWYAETKAGGRAVGAIVPAIDDYGDAKAGAAVATEIAIESQKDGVSQTRCFVFAWIEGSPRKNPQAFSCDDVAGVEKWKTEQALKSAWR